MFELKVIRKEGTVNNDKIKAFALEKGDQSIQTFSKASFYSALKKASRRIDVPKPSPKRSKT